MKFSNYSRLQPTQFNSPMLPVRPVTLNSFAAFADDSGIPVTRYAPGGDIYSQLVSKYGKDVAAQVYNAAQNGDRASMSQILGSAIPLGQPGGGSIQPLMDDSITDAFIDQITSDPLQAPVDALIGKGSTGTGSLFGTTTSKVILIGGLAAIAYFALSNKH